MLNLGVIHAAKGRALKRMKSRGDACVAARYTTDYEDDHDEDLQRNQSWRPGAATKRENLKVTATADYDHDDDHDDDLRGRGEGGLGTVTAST